jgi:hypothetical protein
VPQLHRWSSDERSIIPHNLEPPAEHVRLALDHGRAGWPLSLVTELHIFGSFARGAIEPHDVDMDVEFEIDQRWAEHFTGCLAYGATRAARTRPDRRPTRMPVPVQLPGPR